MSGLDSAEGVHSSQRLKTYRELVVLAALVGVADALLCVTEPYAIAAWAALVIVGFLPGILCVWMLTEQQSQIMGCGERLLHGLGMGYALIVLTIMLISYLPGGLTRAQVLITAHVMIGLLAAAILLTGQTPMDDIAGASRAARERWWHCATDRPWRAAALAVFLLTVLILRFVNLGYSEFQGDEAVVALRAVDVIQGYEGALFGHLKGPAEILLPTVVYSLTGRLTEFTARMPFALANVLALFAFALLATRLLGFAVGWFCAMLLAVSGYLVAFGRVMQYQSLVLFMVCLTLLLLQRLLANRNAMAQNFGLIAAFMSVGLLGHYAAIFAAAPALYVMWRIVRDTHDIGSVVRALRWPVALGALVLASFLVPFALNPELPDSLRYIFGYRMGGGSSLATLIEIWQRSALYDSAYAVVLVLGLAAIAETRSLWRTVTSQRDVIVVGIVWLGLGFVYLLSEPSSSSGFGLAKLGVLLALATPIASPATPADERMIWWWLAGPVMVLLFYTAVPGTHVYSIAPPLTIIAGFGANHILTLAKRLRWPRTNTASLAVLAATCLLLILGYVTMAFVRNQPEMLRNWRADRPWGYWMPFHDPPEWAIFGFPLRNGWKTVSVLFSRGELQGAYATNSRPAVAEWYLRGEAPCERDDPQTYLLAQKVEPVYLDDTEELRRQWAEKQSQYGTVTVNSERKMLIFQDAPVEGDARELADADYAPVYDRELSGIFQPLSGPVAAMPTAKPVQYRFGPDIELVGYDLAEQDYRPGEEVDVTLYWRASKRSQADYQVSVQVVDLTDYHKAGQRDGEPVCNQLPTSAWIPGDLIADRYRFTIADDAKPGAYSLFVVMYAKEGAVLDVTDGEGKPVGGGAALTSVEVGP